MRVEASIRFWSKVKKTESCWLWTGTLRKDGRASGYGMISINNKTVKAHRYAWELMRGPITSKLDIEHACHTLDESCIGGPTCLHRRCVNPDHLTPMPHSENAKLVRKRVKT